MLTINCKIYYFGESESFTYSTIMLKKESKDGIKADSLLFIN